MRPEVNDKVELGACLLYEGAQAGDRELGGVDLRVRVGRATEFRAEVARSQSDLAESPSDSDAYLAELTHVTERLDGRVYAREHEQAFGLGQQLSTETGTRKYGAEGRLALSERIAVQGEAYRQEYVTDSARRDAAVAEVRTRMIRAAWVGVKRARASTASVTPVTAIFMGLTCAAISAHGSTLGFRPTPSTRGALTCTNTPSAWISASPSHATWIAVGYKLVGFHDEDFSRNRYTDQGPFIKLRVKADQDTFKDIASRH